ncbi:hypothetical protein AHAS_Ahas03G0154300 [Arachis hypogaea]
MVWRNKEILEADYRRPLNPHMKVLKSVNDMREAFERSQKKQCFKRKEAINIKWNYPLQGWVTLNTDGAMKGSTKQARYGGLIRNETGKWVAGFSYHIGRCSTFNTKIWGIKKGFEIATTMGMKNIIVECDSKVVIEVLNSKRNLNNHPNSLIRDINRWKDKSLNI